MTIDAELPRDESTWNPYAKVPPSAERNASIESFRSGGCAVSVDRAAGLIHVFVPQGESLQLTVPRPNSLFDQIIVIKPEPNMPQIEKDIPFVICPGREITLTRM